MTSKSRYFLVGASLTLVLGLAVGLVAYYSYRGGAGAEAGLPAELGWVPSDADMVAYANVSAVMHSGLRRDLENLAAGHGRGGRHPMHEVVGIDLEEQVSHVVAYVSHPEQESGVPPQVLLLCRGTFDQARVEQFLLEHGGTAEEYHAKRLVTRHRTAAASSDPNRNQNPSEAREPHQEFAVGFVEPGLVAVGRSDLVRHALDRPSSALKGSAGVASNAEMIEMIRHTAGSTAWVVGRFEAVKKTVGIPDRLTQQVPQLRLVSAKANINGGLKATLRAETADAAAADQMRDVVRGFVSLARLQAGTKPELQSVLKSLELSGTGTTVQMSFALTPETFRAMIPTHRPPADQQPEQR